MDASDTVSFSCFRCGFANEVAAVHAGRRGRCGGCRAVMRIPAAELALESRCRGCTRWMQAGIDYCARCTRPTILRLVLISLGFLALGAPLAVGCGAITLAAAEEGTSLSFIYAVAIVAAGAVCAGGFDLLRALVALATGEDEVEPLATKWVLSRLGA